MDHPQWVASTVIGWNRALLQVQIFPLHLWLTKLQLFAVSDEIFIPETTKAPTNATQRLDVRTQLATTLVHVTEVTREMAFNVQARIKADFSFLSLWIINYDSNYEVRLCILETDSNECEAEVSNCGENAVCENKQGGFTCKCDQVFYSLLELMDLHG